jgi:hypothetical protein
MTPPEFANLVDFIDRSNLLDADWRGIIRQHGLDDCSNSKELQECEKMTNRSIADFKHESDSVSLTKLEGKLFTIVAVEDSNYEDSGNVSQGVKITTKERHLVDGEPRNKFHTTRTAIVNKLRDPAVREALANGDTIGPVKAQLQKAKKGGKDYFDLIPA